MPLIAEASVKREAAYVEIRDKIVQLGADVLPILGVAAVDESLPWQQRLVARICYERIEQKEVIERILKMDWYNHSGVKPEWNGRIIGPEGGIAANLVKPEIQEAGLWYYCLEVEWKMTGETGNLRNDGRYNYWVFVCTDAVKGNPEERIWFLRVCADLMAISPPPARFRQLYYNLMAEKSPDSAPLLLRHFDAFKATRPVGFDPDGWLIEVAGYADSRSADLFDQFLKTHPNPFNLTSGGIRARPAPPPPPEHFRLGTNIIRRAKQE